VIEDLSKRHYLYYELVESILNKAEQQTREQPLKKTSVSVQVETNEEKTSAGENKNLEESLGLEELENELNKMADIEVQVDIDDSNLTGLESGEVAAIEEKEKQRLIDKEREDLLAIMEAKLAEKLEENKELDTDGAKNLIAKVESFLTCIKSNKNGLSAIRKKDVEELRSIRKEIEDSQLINLLRSKYPNSSIARVSV
jgi:hypothetical protein